MEPEGTFWPLVAQCVLRVYIEDYLRIGLSCWVGHRKRTRLNLLDISTLFVLNLRYASRDMDAFYREDIEPYLSRFPRLPQDDPLAESSSCNCLTCFKVGPHRRVNIVRLYRTYPLAQTLWTPRAMESMIKTNEITGIGSRVWQYWVTLMLDSTLPNETNLPATLCQARRLRVNMHLHQEQLIAQLRQRTPMEEEENWRGVMCYYDLYDANVKELSDSFYKEAGRLNKYTDVTYNSELALFWPPSEKELIFLETLHWIESLLERHQFFPCIAWLSLQPRTKLTLLFVRFTTKLRVAREGGGGEVGPIDNRTMLERAIGLFLDNHMGDDATSDEAVALSLVKYREYETITVRFYEENKLHSRSHLQDLFLIQGLHYIASHMERLAMQNRLNMLVRCVVEQGRTIEHCDHGSVSRLNQLLDLIVTSIRLFIEHALYEEMDVLLLASPYLTDLIRHSSRYADIITLFSGRIRDQPHPQSHEATPLSLFRCPIPAKAFYTSHINQVEPIIMTMSFEEFDLYLHEATTLLLPRYWLHHIPQELMRVIRDKCLFFLREFYIDNSSEPLHHFLHLLRLFKEGFKQSDLNLLLQYTPLDRSVAFSNTLVSSLDSLLVEEAFRAFCTTTEKAINRGEEQCSACNQPYESCLEKMEDMAEWFWPRENAPVRVFINKLQLRYTEMLMMDECRSFGLY